MFQKYNFNKKCLFSFLAGNKQVYDLPEQSFPEYSPSQIHFASLFTTVHVPWPLHLTPSHGLTMKYFEMKKNKQCLLSFIIENLGNQIRMDATSAQ